MLHCPACGHKQLCPCPTCIDQREQNQTSLGVKPWKWTLGLGMRCGFCGFEQSAKWWEGLSKSIESWHQTALLTPITKDVTKEAVEFLSKLEKGKL